MRGIKFGWNVGCGRKSALAIEAMPDTGAWTLVINGETRRKPWFAFEGSIDSTLADGTTAKYEMVLAQGGEDPRIAQMTVDFFAPQDAALFFLCQFVKRMARGVMAILVCIFFGIYFIAQFKIGL
jgi:hypothetical protein